MERFERNRKNLFALHSLSIASKSRKFIRVICFPQVTQLGIRGEISILDEETRGAELSRFDAEMLGHLEMIEWICV